MDIRTLRDYCLDPNHPRGRYKTRVFEVALSITREQAKSLQEALLSAARSYDAVAGETDQYGRRYVLDFSMRGPRGDVVVRSAWIVRAGEDVPRLTSCSVA